MERPSNQLHSSLYYAVRSLQQLLRMPSGQQINAGAYSIEVEGADGHILFTVPLDLPIVQRSDY